MSNGVKAIRENEFPTSDQYTDMVRRYAEIDSPEMIENASIGHALEIAKALFGSAERHGEDVRIVTGCLLAPFYRNLVEGAKKVLDKASIRVIVFSQPSKEIVDSEFYKTVTDHERGTVEFYPEPEGTEAHFILVGDRRYRIESDDRLATAFACFNDPSFGAFLLGMFAGILSKMREAN